MGDLVFLLMRINKFLARAGVASRRKADLLVESKEIMINGKTASFSDKVDPKLDTVLYNGKKVISPDNYSYFILNKPESVISAVTDDRGRKTVIDFMPNIDGLFPVGRLDFDVSGSLIITNDGELAYTLTHPKFEVSKIYIAKLSLSITDEQINKIESGIIIENHNCKAQSVKRLDSDSYTIEITMTEGRKREVKKLLEAVGNPIIKLSRTSFAGIGCGNLKKGTYRELAAEEIATLKENC